MSGSVTYELSAQDNVDAINAHSGKFLGKLAWVFLFLAAINVAVDWWAHFPILNDSSTWTLVGAWIFFSAWDWIARDWIIRRQYRQSVKMRSPIKLSWDDEAVTFDTDKSHAVYPWKDFFKWMGSTTSLLLYRDAGMFFPVPRRALPDDAYEEMVQALRAAGVREAGRRQSAQSRPISS
jgi:YcxB-like protein